MQKSIRQQMFKNISRWQKSGLSQKAWCEKNGMAYATFHYWYKRYRSQDKQEPAAGFVQLMVDDPGSAGCFCELLVPDGRKLVFHETPTAEFLKILIG